MTAAQHYAMARQISDYGNLPTDRSTALLLMAISDVLMALERLQKTADQAIERLGDREKRR